MAVAVKHPQLDQIRQRLRASGYSRSYISRITDELHDHFESIISENGNPSFADRDGVRRDLEIRVGTSESIVDAVRVRPELTPWARRFPFLTFFIVPGFVLCLGSLLMIWIGQWMSESISQWLSIDQSLSIELSRTAVSVFRWSSIALPIIFSAVLVLIAVRARMPWRLLAAGTSIVALGGLFVFDFGTCAQSGQTKFFPHWGFDAWRFLSPIGVFAVGILFVRRASSVECRTVQDAIDSHVPLHRILVAPVLLGIIGATYFLSMQTVKTVTQPHAVDPMLESMNSRVNRANATLQVLKSEPLCIEIGLGDAKLTQLQNRLEDFERHCQQIWETWMAEHPDRMIFQPFEPTALQAYVINTEAEILAQLVASQRKRVRQVVYRGFGWKALFLTDVQKELNLSKKQLLFLKDQYLAQIKNETDFLRSIQKADETDRSRLAQLQQSYLQAFEARTLSALSGEQRRKLRIMQGENFEPNANVLASLNH